MSAGPLAEDEPLFAPSIELRDTPPHELFDTASTSQAPIWLSLSAGVALLKNGRRSIEASLLLSIPLERFALRPPSAGTAQSIADAPVPTLKPPPRRPAPDPAPPPKDMIDPPEAPSASPPTEAPKIEIPVLITPEIARSATRAALRHARLEDASARVDALATRARSSALLPEIRLRASRLVDEAEQLSPTEYDPGRVTASGGTSVWLEARGTWRLDRILFADEEIALEKMRHDRADAQAKLIQKVLELLFAWQRAVALKEHLESAASADIEARVTAALNVAETEASLDVITGGWFGRFRKSPAGKRGPL
ncbi:MAG: hypothetical protein HUU21_38330 [Polyangiaceae bacterium]|nr:hypothetical protein [Polyangiaceae bacterium]